MRQVNTLLFQNRYRNKIGLQGEWLHGGMLRRSRFRTLPKRRTADAACLPVGPMAFGVYVDTCAVPEYLPRRSEGCPSG